MQHQDRYLAPARVAVRHILVGSEAEARRLEQEARGGADFAALAKRHSIDEATRDIGGALGYVQEGSEILGLGRNEMFTQKVTAMGAGDVDLFRSAKGWHVVKVEKRDGGGLLPLEQVYREDLDPMLKQRFAAIYNDELVKARDAAGVNYDSENFEKFTGVPNNCDRLMDMAEQSPTR